MYFSSTYLPNKVYNSLEELFIDVEPSKTILVLDSNIVIYYRDFYLNPKNFSSDSRLEKPYYQIRYLSEQIYRYDLKVLATLGIDESSRSKKDFSVNEEKFKQTRESLLFLLHLNFNYFDTFIKLKKEEEPIKLKGKHPKSMIELLNPNCFYINHLIIGYLTALKIHILYQEIKTKAKSKIMAINELLEFMVSEVDCVTGIFYLYSLHLFSNNMDFKNIFINKNNKPILPQIFNGTIDLILPTLVNKVANYQYKETIIDAIPVFVSSDKKISKLHSLIETKLTVGLKKEETYYPEIIKSNFANNLKWSNDELLGLDQKIQKIAQERLNKKIGEPKHANHLLHLIPKYEKELIEKIKNCS